ncbi:MAG TPA: 4a-hydroxytetrahydrobiopterin dehydratase [Oculatellaceae cyanobacterium]|jgi:4a-hydroxytetrahydrobiopterin dehydratase
MKLLSETELLDCLSPELALWQFKDSALERVYRAGSYFEALEKLNAIARQAESANHHPELTLNWKTLIIRYWTHTVGGVTTLDVEQAKAAEKLLG